MLYKDQPAPRPDAEELARQLRVAVRRGRSWKKGRRIAGGVLLVLLVAALAWWFWPRPGVVTVLVVAFDQLTVPDTNTTVRIGTEPADAKLQSWGGQDVYLEELKALRAPGEVPKIAKVHTDNKGEGAVDWKFAATPLFTLIEGRYLDERTKPPWYDKSQGRVFVWPPQTPLLLVTLTGETEKSVDLKAMAEGLERAERMGWKVVYLATQPDRPLKYKELRDWALQQMAEDAQPCKLPTGPVLARWKYFTDAREDDEKGSQELIIGALVRQFKGPIVRVEKASGMPAVNADDAGFKIDVRLQLIAPREEKTLVNSSWERLDETLSFHLKRSKLP